MKEADKHKKKKYTVRMDIELDTEITHEEAEIKIMSALRSVGMKAHRGGIA